MSSWPLTGRAEELSRLTALLGGGATTKGVVIAGGAGVGKTRLAREVGAAAADRGWVVRSLQGTAAGQGVPLGAFSQWVEGLDEHPLTLVSSVISSITAHVGNAAVMVVVDDVHLLDDLSAFVLHQLVRRNAATVIATLRSGELAPKTLSELWKDGELQRLDLQPLSRQESAALLEAVLDGPVNRQSATRLWELTQGNVLFMHELVRQERHAGRLARGSGDQWTWTGPVSVSPSLADLVEVYIGAAPESVLEVLDLLAVAEPLELRYLIELTDRQAIEDAERLELIEVSGDSTNELVRIGHPLYGEARRARLGRMRARRLRGRVAQVMRSPSLGGPRVDPVRLALLWLESDLPGDPKVHYEGAATAFRRLDAALTERLAQAAAQAGAPVESRILYARALSLLGRGRAAEELLNELTAGREPSRAWVAAKQLLALNLLLTQGQPEKSWTLIEEALTQTPAPLDQELLALRALQLAMTARPREVVDLLDSIDRAELTPPSRINLNFGVTIALGDLGRLEQATRTPEDELVLSAQTPVAALQAVSLGLIHVDALVVSGNITEAKRLSDRLVEQWSNLPDVSLTIASAVTALAAVAHGDLRVAQERLEAALATEDLRGDSGELPFFGIGYWLRIAYAEALARAGDANAAATALRDTERNKHPSFGFLEPNLLLASAWVAAARGRASEALALVGDAVEFARSHGQHAREVLCLQTAIQFGDSTYHGDRLAELAELVEGPRVKIATRWAEGLSARDGNALSAVSEELEEIGDRVGAADAAAHAAQMFHAGNLRGSKLTASARATQLAANCGAKTIATQETSAPLPLSRREREIANMVRDGLSNKDIATELTMSVRTVEGHIYRACNKLGLANRAELAQLIANVTG